MSAVPEETAPITAEAFLACDPSAFGAAWRYELVAAAILRLDSLGIELPLAVLYENVGVPG